jgi:hypothetical protein
LRRWCAPGLGSRTAGGGSGAAVSRAIVERERERARDQKFAKCGERERGPEILVRGHNARHAPTTRVSLFLVLETCVLAVHLAFYCKGRRAGSSASCIDPKACLV